MTHRPWFECAWRRVRRGEGKSRPRSNTRHPPPVGAFAANRIVNPRRFRETNRLCLIPISEYMDQGVGEVGFTGTAGAVASAVWHATGTRELPITMVAGPRVWPPACDHAIPPCGWLGRRSSHRAAIAPLRTSNSSTAQSNEMIRLSAWLSGRLERVWRHHQISMGATTPPSAWSQT